MENEKNTVHETVEEKIAKKNVEADKSEEKVDAKTQEKPVEKKEALSDDEIIDINKEEKKEEQKTAEVTSKTSRKSSPKSTEDFIKKQKKRKRTRTLVILLVIAAIICAIVLWVRNIAKKAKEALQDITANNIETSYVEKKTLYDTKNATGTLYALDSKTLSTNLGSGIATIEAVNVGVGDYVQEGDILVQFSTENIEKTINETREDISTQKQVDAVDAEDAQRNYVYSYSSIATTMQNAAKSVDDALFDLHEACDAYGTAKRELKEIQDMSLEEYKEYLINKGKINRDAPTTEDSLRIQKDSEIETKQNAVNQAFQTQEQKQKVYDAAVEKQAQTINDVQSGGNSMSAADSNYKKSQLNAGKQVTQLERSLEKSIDSLDDYVVTATISGIVTDVNVTEGNKFASGNVLTIQDNSSYKAQVLVDEYDIPKVKKAFEKAKSEGRELKVVVKTDATGDQEFAGHVTLIAPTSTATTAVSVTTSASSNGVTSTASSSSTANYKVDIVLDEIDDALMIGMSAKVAIVVDESPADSLCVPYNTIKVTSDGKYVVCVMDENGDHSTADDMFGAGNKSGKDSKKSGAIGGAEGGIVVEINDDSKDEKKGLASKFSKNSKEPEEQGRRYREVEVDKIFETDFYAAIVPKVSGSINEGDEVLVVTEKASGNDIMAMFGGMGGGGPRD